MHLWIVGGGTGGHVYPALAVVQALRDADPHLTLTWVGTARGMEAQLVKREAIPFLAIPAAGVHGVGISRLIMGSGQLLLGYLAALRHLRREKPDALLTTGGYVSVPAALAARHRGVPIVLFLPDIEPAQSVRFVARLARRIATTVEDSRRFLPAEKVVVTGYPLRKKLSRWSRAEARARLNLPADATVVLIFGGSRGARSINRAVLDNLSALTAHAHILHISGRLDWPEVSTARDALPSAIRRQYHAFEYVHEMGMMLAAADLVVSRAGAGVLGEFPHFGLPSILVPYPYAWRYQRVNAAWLADRGAAIIVEDAQLRERLAPTVQALLADADRLQAMAVAARSLARPDAARRIANLLTTVASGGE